MSKTDNVIVRTDCISVPCMLMLTVELHHISHNFNCITFVVNEQQFFKSCHCNN
jgi:hypothetical protein